MNIQGWFPLGLTKDCNLGNFIKIKVFHERGLIHVLFLLFLQNLLKWVLGIRQRNNEKGGKCVQVKIVSSLWPSKDPDSVMPKYSMGVFSHVQLFENPWIVVHQAPLSMGFPSQEYWGGFPCPPPGDLPDPGIKPESSASSASAGGFGFFLPLSHQEDPDSVMFGMLCLHIMYMTVTDCFFYLKIKETDLEVLMKKGGHYYYSALHYPIGCGFPFTWTWKLKSKAKRESQP